MSDPGDGSIHQEYNFTLLKYAGDGKWSYEEDIYNPAALRHDDRRLPGAKEAADPRRLTR